MSDVAAAAESSAPMSSTDVAASVVESFESGETGTESTPSVATSETGESDTRPVTETTQNKTEPTAAEVSAARKFLQKMGHADTNKRGGNTYLPYGTVEKMLDKYAEEHGQTWQTERTTIESRSKELQSQIEQLRAGVAGDPRAFLSEIASIDPRYKAFLESQPQARQTPAADDPMPAPDYDLGNGNKTYSLEGLQKRDEWVQRQLLRQLEGKLDERLKPLTEREDAAKARDEHEKVMHGLRERASSQMQEAQTWPLFGTLSPDGALTEFQQSVLDELKADTDKATKEHRRPSLTLEGAYIRVASKRMTEDDATTRGRLLKEISAAPKSTATGRTTTDAAATPAKRSTADIVREVVSKAGA